MSQSGNAIHIIYIYMQPRGSVNEIALQQSFAELTSEPISNTLQVFEKVYIYIYYMYEKKAKL